MYSQNSRQFVIKQASGKLWNVYHDEKLGLCCSTLTKRNTWSAPVQLQKDAHPSFHADIDNMDRIHILAQDGTGSLLYTLFSGESVQTVPALNSKTPAVYDKHLYVLISDRVLNFFYVLKHGDAWILSHQISGDGQIGTPRVVDYVIKNNCPYIVLCDLTGNIYAFYPSSDGRYHQMGYKKYIPSRKYWGEFTPVSRYEGDAELPSAVADGKSIIHLSYQRQSGRQYELVYQQKVPDKNIWSSEAVIHSSMYPFNQSSILVEDNSIVIFWVRDDTIYFSSSNDYGTTWSKPCRYNFAAGRQLMCVAYRTNSDYESGKIHVRDLPGSFIGGLKLGFLPDITREHPEPSADDLKDMIVDSLRLLKGSVEELEESISLVKDAISKLGVSQDNLEKELAKLSVRLGLIENEAGMSKALTGRVGKLETSVNGLRAALEERASVVPMKEIIDALDVEKGEIISDILESEALRSVVSDIQGLQAEISALKAAAGRRASKARNDLENKIKNEPGDDAST